MKDNTSYCALRFRSSDALHKRGDIHYVTESELYIGQTDECGLKLIPHPDYADCCYAVMHHDTDTDNWFLIRQEPTASITVNGVAINLVTLLHHGDLLKFDNTIMRLTMEHGARPAVQYVKNKTQWGLWAMMTLVVSAIACIVWYMHSEQQKPEVVFKQEINSIYKIEAIGLIVLSQDNDTLDNLPLQRVSVGTGFVTDNACFVTARHCIEFWLAMEHELRPSINDIQSPFVRWAICAEEDTTVRLVSQLRITSYDGKQVWYASSEDFLMDKSRDAIYDYGDADSSYLWRSVVSNYEKHDTELGDVAVMKWHANGTIKFDASTKTIEAHDPLVCFGYPQSESRQQAQFASVETDVFQTPPSADYWFICNTGLLPGFSGGPVFVHRTPTERMLAGLVSRSASNRTLIVPAAQIRNLINQLEKQ